MRSSKINVSRLFNESLLSNKLFTYLQFSLQNVSSILFADNLLADSAQLFYLVILRPPTPSFLVEQFHSQMSELPIFNGKGDVQRWISRMEKYFAEEGIPEEAVMERFDSVQPYLSGDVKACMQVLSGHLQARLEPGMLWIWKWPSFSYALRKTEGKPPFRLSDV